MPNGLRCLVCLLLLAVSVAFAKEPPSQVLQWPAQGPPLIRFSIGRFNDIGSYSGQHNFTAEVMAENLWTKPIKSAAFRVYFYDKQKVRNGEGYMSVTDLPVNGKAKFELSVTTRGTPNGLELVAATVPDEFAKFMPTKEVPITVNSVPQGATLRVDGQEVGTTPKIVKFTTGKHMLSFQMSGYQPGSYPFEVKTDEAPGGAITFEMGSAMHDTVELRDGSVLTGDVETLSATEVEIRIGGAIQKLNRNSVKKILLIERVPVDQAAQ